MNGKNICKGEKYKCRHADIEGYCTMINITTEYCPQ